MLTIIILWIYMLFIILPFGFILLLFNKRSTPKITPNLSYFTLSFLIGLIFLTTISSFFSFFINIGWQVHLFVVIISLSIWYYLYRSKRIPTFNLKIGSLNKIQLISLVLLFISVCITIFSATTAPENPDTGIYHAQAIRWIETYRAIPGLGNLHARFAYNSSWLIINALFSLSFLKIQSFHALPSLLFLVSISYFFSGVFEVSAGSRKTSDLVKYMFFVAAFLLLPKEVSSPGTDLPVTLLLWIICSEWVRSLERTQDNSIRNVYWLAVIAGFCTNIKLSSVPIIIFIFWVLINEFRKKRFTSILLLFCAAVIIYAPFIGRNIILSGHLFYPGLKADPIHVDWGIPLEWVQIEKSTIHSFAVLPREEFDTMPWQIQYKKWFYNQIPRHKAMLAYLGFISIPILLLLPFKKWRNLLYNQSFIVWPIITMYAGVVFWLITAPTFRFGYGFILSAVTLTGSLFVQFIIEIKNKFKVAIQVLAIVLTLLIVVNAGKGAIRPETFMNRIILPLDYPEWNTKKCDFGNFTIQCAAEWASCWYSPFPCVVKGEPNVEMRGTDFIDGFRGIP